jgi:hypothetical protein
MKTKKVPYYCVLYEPGDVVIDRFGEDTRPRRIISVRDSVIGNLDAQLLKFADSKDDLNLSNHFVPYGTTAIKYANGVPTKNITNLSVKLGFINKKESKIRKRIEEEMDLSQFIRVRKVGESNPQ